MKFLRGLGSVLLACLIACVLVIAATNVAVVASSQGRIVEEDEAAASGADAIVVLGASVYGNTPSTILSDRLDAAVQLYFDGAAPVIIVSGDGTADDYNEPRTMKNYLVEQGVSSDDVLCDYEGLSTRDTMSHAAEDFGAQSVVVVTQTYHLYRALYDAQAAGMDSVGFASDYSEYSDQLRFDVREVFARTKDCLEVLTEPIAEALADAGVFEGLVGAAR